MQDNIPICGQCKGSVTLEPDINGNKNVWFVCNTCELSFSVHMNEGYNLSKIPGYEYPENYDPTNPLCYCNHTLKYHKETGICMGCDCTTFRPM